MWEVYKSVPGVIEEIQRLYAKRNFYWEIRYCLHEFIDGQSQNWVQFDFSNPSHIPMAQSLYNELIAQMKMFLTSNHSESYLFRPAIQNALESIKEQYDHQPTALIHLMAELLMEESEIFQRVGQSCMSTDGPNVSVAQEIDSVRREARQLGEMAMQYRNEVEEYRLIRVDLSRHSSCLTQMVQNPQHFKKSAADIKLAQSQNDELRNKLMLKAKPLPNNFSIMMDKIKVTLLKIMELQKVVLDINLVSWKRNQQLSGNGAPLIDNLDTIQQWCEGLAEILWEIRQRLRELRAIVENPQTYSADKESATMKLEELTQQVTQLLSSLVTSTFVIEKQPPQVLKTNTRFTAYVRLLVGGKLNVQMNPPQVSVSIMSENQANVLLRNDKLRDDNVGEIMNNTTVMEYNQTTRVLNAHFRNMQLKKIKRPEKKGQECVMDEKFALLFQSTFSIGGGELVFQVWTLSLPVVVIVHGNQEPQAVATLSWDNSFATPERQPFQVPEAVPWPRVAEMLNTKFESACERPLSSDNLQFLAAKAFRGSVHTDYSGMNLSWQQFCKDPLPERQFSFWEWFYATLKVTSDQSMKNLWKDGLVLGFIGKEEAKEQLLKKPEGTFLIRYSDSERGGISVSWVVRPEPACIPVVYSLHPTTLKDFGVRTLADRIKDLAVLRYLFPSVNKDDAFGKYYTQVPENVSNGYVKPDIMITVRGMDAAIPSYDTQVPSPANYQQGAMNTDPSNDYFGGMEESYFGVGSEDLTLDLSSYPQEELDFLFLQQNMQQ